MHTAENTFCSGLFDKFSCFFLDYNQICRIKCFKQVKKKFQGHLDFRYRKLSILNESVAFL